MRYTTIIDISELPMVYRNHNARLVYIHMALKCGYHDDDRDLLAISIRNLAWATGLTVSATRHALAVLERSGLLAKDGEKWRIKKWVAEPSVTPRKQANVLKPGTEQSQSLRKLMDENETRIRRINEWLANAKKRDILEVLEHLRTRKSYVMNGERIYPSAQAIEFLEQKLEKL